MTLPNGSAGIDNTDYGVTAGGSVPGMTGRTQSAISTAMKQKVADSQGWKAADNTFFGSILGGFTTGITGLVSNLFSHLSGLSGGSFLDLVGQLLGFQNRVTVAEGQIVSISTGQQQANTRLDALESFAGTGITTPLWSSIGGRDISTFPDSMMLQLYYTDNS